MNLTLIRADAIRKGHLKAISQVEQTDLVAIVDTDLWAKEIAAAVGASLYATTGTMLRSLVPDGVIVSTLTNHHLQPLINSLQTGAHVLVEKLITPTMRKQKLSSPCRRSSLGTFWWAIIVVLPKTSLT